MRLACDFKLAIAWIPLLGTLWLGGSHGSGSEHFPVGPFDPDAERISCPLGSPPHVESGGTHPDVDCALCQLHSTFKAVPVRPGADPDAEDLPGTHLGSLSPRADRLLAGSLRGRSPPRES